MAITIIWFIAYTLCATLFIAFTFVVLFGAPFLPTLKDRVPEAIKLIGLKEGETLLELGSGDGRVLRCAAENGLNAIGYELNPLLVIYSKIKCYKYRRNVRIIWGNYWNKSWPEAQGIFVFLLQPYMEKLNKKIIQDKITTVKVVSFAFTIDSKKPKKSVKGLYLYEY